MNALNTTASVFYFYNPTTVSFGKIEFKRWEIELWEAIGERHRWLIRMYFQNTLNTNQEQVEGKLKEEIIVEVYS
jgi:hypothetical protein